MLRTGLEPARACAHSHLKGGVGHLFVVLRPDLFVEREVFEESVEKFVREVKDAPVRAGVEVLVPGEIEQRTRAERSLSELLGLLQRDPAVPGGEVDEARTAAREVRGMISGLLAQYSSRIDDAVAAAVYLHGLAGELGAAEIGEKALIATDLLQFLPEAMDALVPHRV